jgi:drug/metabolite transporter (DMT)-like permease
VTNNWKLGLGFSLLTVLMWGGLPLSLKVILGEMDSITVTWYRFSASALIALIWYGRSSVQGVRRLLSRPLWPLTLFAVCGLLTNYILYLLGLDRTTPEAAQILIQLAPLLLLLGSVLLFKEPFSTPQWLGVIGFTLGLLMFFHHRLRTLASIDERYLLGMLIMVLSAVTWAGYGLAQKKLLKQVRANDLLLLIYIAGSLCFLPGAEPGQILQLDGFALWMLAFASLNTIVAYGSFGLAMTYWDTSRVSAVITLSPLLTLLLVFLTNFFYPGFIQTEPLDWLNWLGAILVVGGSTLAALGGGLKQRFRGGQA